MQIVSAIPMIGLSACRMQPPYRIGLPLLHTDFGHYTGEQVNRFIQSHDLFHKVDLVASHGHTTFHVPSRKMTAQLGDGAAIAAVTGLPVVSDLRAMDVAYGGQGAPIVPIGEKLLLEEYDMLLNLGGIANISYRNNDEFVAFDICAANRVLNMLAGKAGKTYDENGTMAASGSTNRQLLEELNGLEYYKAPYPKSLANDFGTDRVYPVIQQHGLTTEDALRTYVEHICTQVRSSVIMLQTRETGVDSIVASRKILVTGGWCL
jgi:anhydro-N-acetylmuramic acid kinase